MKNLKRFNLSRFLKMEELKILNPIISKCLSVIYIYGKHKRKNLKIKINIIYLKWDIKGHKITGSKYSF